ncbi:VirB8/TrbF family protein [Chromobacterium vaccinii]|uniref:VirB8/TrbF family protein n=1 Tax=Chromobacterium vaccinii TaxID=1108595 RepID=UPI003C716DBF
MSTNKLKEAIRSMLGMGESNKEGKKFVENPFERTRDDNDDRQILLLRHAQNWRRMAFIAIALAAWAVWKQSELAAIPKVVPYIVEKDKLGRTVAVASAESLNRAADAENVQFGEATEFITHLRAVSADMAVQKKNMDYVYSRLPDSSKARGFVNQFYHVTRDPWKLAERATIMPEIKTAFRVSENTWQVEWKETTVNLKGQQEGLPQCYKSQITQLIDPPKKEDDLRKNSVGWFVNDLSWATMLMPADKC